MPSDILITNGRVLDGTGTPAVEADVLISDGRIAGVGRLEPPRAATVFDAAGLTVSPGFIDAHTHAEFVIASEHGPRYMEPFIRQGITTMVTGNCGVSAAPINPTCIGHLSSYWDCLLPEEGLDWTWRTVDEFLARFSERGAVLNLAQLVGHGTVRMHVMGYAARCATAEELQAMRTLVRESLEAGAVGISYGLTYIPGTWGDPDELLEVARDLPRIGGLVSVHLRNQTRFLVQAVEEMIRIAESLETPLQLSHYGPYGAAFAHEYFRTLELTDQARARGVQIGYDLMTPPVASTTVCQLYPPWMFEGGFPAFLDRLADAAVRRRLADELTQEPEWPSWETHQLAENMCAFVDDNGAATWPHFRLNGFRRPDNLQYEFQPVESIAHDRGTGTFETLFDLTLEEEGRLFFTGVGVDDDDLDQFAGTLYQMPHYSFMTDSVGIGRKARATSIYGTFPRFLGRHVREWNTFPLEEAVRKGTSLPAQQHGLAGRGTIRKGHHADLVIFDPQTILDKATFARPYQFADGIHTVIINGVPVWHDGQFHPDAMAGQVIRRN